MMAPSTSQPGAGMSPGLASLLAGQAPPQTAMSAQTPDIRRNPTHEWYVALQRVRMTVRDALTKADEQDESIKEFLSSVRTACDKLLTGVNPKASIATSLARAIESWAPQIAQMLDVQAVMLMQQGQNSPMPTAPGVGAPPPGGQPPPMLGGAPGAPTPAPGPGAAAL